MVILSTEGKSAPRMLAVKPAHSGARGRVMRCQRAQLGNVEPAVSNARPATTRYLVSMSDPLTARDLCLLLKLPHDERVRLAKLALKAAATDDAAAYRAAPSDASEFG